MTKVWEEDLSSNEKIVLLAICDNANDEGLCYPSIITIQKKTSLSKPTVIKIINQLINNGFIKKHIRSRKNGGRYSNLYLVYPNETLSNLDDEYREKFIQSKEVLLPPQSKATLPQEGIQSKVALPKPSLTIFNHHLYKQLDNKEKSLYLEYITIRKKKKLITTDSIHNRLLSKYFEFGRDIDIIQRAINGNWSDFYPIIQKQEKEILFV
jgi:predicted transcriptional regulator